MLDSARVSSAVLKLFAAEINKPIIFVTIEYAIKIGDFATYLLLKLIEVVLFEPKNIEAE